MLVDPTYSLNGGFRLSLGFPSPLYAGAFLVLLHFALHWLGEFCAQTKISIAIMMSFLCATAFCIGLTGSRTFVAVFAIGTCYMMICEKLASKRLEARLSYRRAILIAGCVLAGLVISGTWVRLSRGYLVQDPSFLNRWPVWVAGVRAFAAASFGGIGADQSAFVYLNWYGPIDDPITITGFSSTLLTIGIEHGVAVFALIIFALTLPCVGPWIIRDQTSKSTAALASGCLCILIFLGTTTLSLSILLTIAETIFVLLALGWTMHSFSDLAPRVVSYAVLGLMAGVTLLTLGLHFAPDYRKDAGSFRLHINSNGNVNVSNARGKDTGQHYLWLVDREITGLNYGNVIRKVFNSAKTDTSFELVLDFSDPRKLPPKLEDQTVIMMGSTRLLSNQTAVHFPCVIVHPTRAPGPQDDTLNVKWVLLPEVDQIGWNESWISWAASRSVPVKINPKTGKNLNFAWQPLSELLSL